VRDAGDVEVDAVAFEGDALGPEASALLLPHRQAAVGADDAPPGQVGGNLFGGEEAGAQPGRARRDVAVGADEALRDLPDGVDDRLVAVVGDVGVLVGQPCCAVGRERAWRGTTERMGRVRICATCVGLVACLVTIGCGGGSGATGGAMTTAGTTSAGGGRHNARESAPSRGIKGENPTTEAASNAHISSSDCVALEKLAEERLGTTLSRRSTPKPPLSRCQLDGPGTSINVYLDSGFAANRRYHNRIEETVQFNYEDQGGVPHPVPHVGEKAAYNSSASWIPNLRSLLAVRGNRWLTVTISIKGKSNRELRDEAAVLARAGFKLTAE